MWNRQKTIGVVLAGAGVFLARIDVFYPLGKTLLISLNAAGVLLALAGIALYAGGMPRELKKAKGCSHCFTKNDASAAICRRCKKPLENPF